MTTCRNAQNLTRWLVLSAAGIGASHPQQIDLRVKSTALLSQTNGPSEPVPHRLK